jgi:hypothetical protein
MSNVCTPSGHVSFILGKEFITVHYISSSDATKKIPVYCLFQSEGYTGLYKDKLCKTFRQNKVEKLNRSAYRDILHIQGDHISLNQQKHDHPTADKTGQN